MSYELTTFSTVSLHELDCRECYRYRYNSSPKLRLSKRFADLSKFLNPLTHGGFTPPPLYLAHYSKNLHKIHNTFGLFVAVAPVHEKYSLLHLLYNGPPPMIERVKV